MAFPDVITAVAFFSNTPSGVMALSGPSGDNPPVDKRYTARYVRSSGVKINCVTDGRIVSDEVEAQAPPPIGPINDEVRHAPVLAWAQEVTSTLQG